MRLDAGYVWLRWRIDEGLSCWHQVPDGAFREQQDVPQDDAPPRRLIYRLPTTWLRLRTRCGLDAARAEDVVTWTGASAPPPPRCEACTRYHLVDTLPPLGTPPVPDRGRRITVRMRRRGSAHAPAGTAP